MFLFKFFQFRDGHPVVPDPKIGVFIYILLSGNACSLDILPRLKRVGFLCANAGRRIRYGLTPAPQFGDAPPKYIFSRIEVAVVYLAAFGTYPLAVAKFQFSVHISTSLSSQNPHTLHIFLCSSLRGIHREFCVRNLQSCAPVCRLCGRVRISASLSDVFRLIP